MGKRSSSKRSGSTPQPAVAPAAPAATPAAAAVADESAPAWPWLEKHPGVQKLILVALWLYVAALCLLALDQWFRWGIFGPPPP